MVEQYKASIQQQTERRNIILAESNALKQQLLELEDRLKQEREILKQQKAHIAQFPPLPSNVFSIIAHSYLQEQEESRWTLMHVSRAFRAATLAVDDLWNLIALHDEECDPYVT